MAWWLVVLAGIHGAQHTHTHTTLGPKTLSEEQPSYPITSQPERRRGSRLKAVACLQYQQLAESCKNMQSRRTQKETGLRRNQWQWQ